MRVPKIVYKKNLNYGKAIGKALNWTKWIKLNVKKRSLQLNMHKIAALHIFFSASFCKLLQLGDSNAHIDLLKNQVELGRVRLLTLRKAWPQLAKHEQYKQQQPSASPPPVTQQLVSQIMQTSSFYHPCSSHQLQVFKPGCGINQCEDGKGVPAGVSDMTNTCKSCACTHCGIRTALCGTREGSVSQQIPGVLSDGTDPQGALSPPRIQQSVQHPSYLLKHKHS